jgi:hypothetical protein
MPPKYRIMAMINIEKGKIPIECKKLPPALGLRNCGYFYKVSGGNITGILFRYCGFTSVFLTRFIGKE